MHTANFPSRHLTRYAILEHVSQTSQLTTGSWSSEACTFTENSSSEAVEFTFEERSRLDNLTQWAGGSQGIFQDPGSDTYTGRYDRTFSSQKSPMLNGGSKSLTSAPSLTSSASPAQAVSPSPGAQGCSARSQTPRQVGFPAQPVSAVFNFIGRTPPTISPAMTRTYPRGEFHAQNNWSDTCHRPMVDSVQRREPELNRKRSACEPERVATPTSLPNVDCMVCGYGVTAFRVNGASKRA